MSGAAMLLAAIGGTPGVINGSLPNGSGSGSATWALINDGTYNISGVSDSNWVTPANTSVAAYYQVKVDATSGGFSTGTTGSYLDLSSLRTWTLESPGTCVFTVTIREKATGIVRSTQAGKTLTVT